MSTGPIPAPSQYAHRHRDEQLDDLHDIGELLEAALTYKMPSGCADLLRSARHRVADLSKKLGGAR